MHVLVRSPHLGNRPFNLLKSCTSANWTLKCLCGENADRRKCFSSSSIHFAVSTDINKNTLLRNLRFSNNSSFLQNSSFYNNLFIRNISLSPLNFDKEPLKPSSKVEETVQVIKKQKEELPAEAPPKAVVKKPLRQRIVDEVIHYYHGFRLLFIDAKISSVLVWRVLNGNTLTRREHRLLVRTVGDMFRLLPFSVFIIVPFMELLLPVFIKFFPGMLPSTFQTATEKEDKIKQNLKVKLEMAKFLQRTLDDMAVQHKDDHNSEQAKAFNEWFKKVRTSGAEVTNQEIMKYSKLFEDEITLDSLSRSQLVALCRVLEVQTLGTNNLLRFQLRMKLRSLAADDKMIQKEGLAALTLFEVQQACRARGMRAYGVSEARLRIQLAQWLDLSLNEKVPPSLLLLSRALMLPETIPTHDKLKATISALPETVVTQTQASIGEKEGKIDNRVKIEVLREEERKIKEERLEQHAEKKKEQDKELLVDKAPTITDKDTPILHDPAKIISLATEKPVDTKSKDEQLRAKDLEVIEHALDNISKDTKKFVVEKETIEDLKEEMADYQEDLQDLKKATAHEAKPAVQETKAAKRLFKRVNKMISQLDSVLGELEDKEKQIQKDLETGDTEKKEVADKKRQELLQIDDIMAAIRKIQDVPDESRIEQIKNVLRKMDDDCDGSVKVEDVLKVIEFIGKDSVQLSAKQVDELIELLDKEEILEVEDKIEKALQKEKELQAEAKQTDKTVQTQKGGQNTKEDGNPKQTPDPKQPPNPKQTPDPTSTTAAPPLPTEKLSKPPKAEAQSPTVPPTPPPINSIDSKKKEDRSKSL